MSGRNSREEAKRIKARQGKKRNGGVRMELFSPIAI